MEEIFGGDTGQNPYADYYWLILTGPVSLKNEKNEFPHTFFSLVSRCPPPAGTPLCSASPPTAALYPPPTATASACRYENLYLMDPKYTGEMLKHLEKQDELLMDAYRSMSHELHKLQVEEEMLMRAFYDLMAAQGLATKRQDGTSLLEDIESTQSKALVNVDSNEKQ
ncbi:hypothetical protein L2E82_07485 [Cichorium intybus]|uniref:Uncharacterized protein n=1 Tax=Cichorium intybus TaxID=13427 RepID=A0ACB9G5F7_CICIN|nr:hypothetical protein L2E82_07485 [Cichorium intybus]